jgi:adenosine kinase
MNILVSGSLAYDRIMDFQGRFSDHILPEKIHVLNVSFTVNSLTEKFGGTAGNIAYALTLLGEHPLISASIGHDYHQYFEWLDKNGIFTENIKIIAEAFTASCFITTDLVNNQITEFHLGAMKYPAPVDFNRLDPGETLVIISPGNLEDMVTFPDIVKPRHRLYLRSGQQLPMLSAKDLVPSIQGCGFTPMIINDLILNKTVKQESLLNLTKTIIITVELATVLTRKGNNYSGNQTT